ncbi:LytR/AlgR family response regulator transcription factor [Algoriphagus sanaruensis]|uniref:LytTR family transcriptional regulator n=1 Tax=Algoriphagus sanaruensis TaxID=1727163 RepID=A0A142EQI8_9BACT|nr:LytTR family DNA-binding domain-containing protein [Algoriphagus sanaruensis]AMQ57393.1 LytTR family transcriptional regulator [Algoriphagus sanaruensis]
MKKKLLLAEDEPLAQQRILAILKKSRPDWEVVTLVNRVSELSDALKYSENYDLILCDIHLADGLSFTAFKGKKVEVPVVFITAYDQYALESFEHNCIDYVLKPIQEERLLRAFDKVCKYSDSSWSESILDQISRHFPAKIYKKRFLAKIGSRLVFIPVDQIAYFYAEDGITFLVESGSSQKYIVDFSLNDLQLDQLDPKIFYRINRSFIINLDHLVEMKPYTNGRLTLSLKAKTDSPIVVAREKVNEFKTWINQ